MANKRPTDDEIGEEINLAVKKQDEGGSNWPGMSYEDGVQAALDWVLDADKERPMEGADKSDEEDDE